MANWFNLSWITASSASRPVKLTIQAELDTADGWAHMRSVDFLLAKQKHVCIVRQTAINYSRRPTLPKLWKTGKSELWERWRGSLANNLVEAWVGAAEHAIRLSLNVGKARRIVCVSYGPASGSIKLNLTVTERNTWSTHQTPTTQGYIRHIHNNSSYRASAACTSVMLGLDLLLGSSH